MSFSFTQYVANGATTQFAVAFPYLTKAHVTVSINGVVDAAKTWPSASIVQTSTTPANGAIVEVRRTTPKDVPQVDFSDASVLTASDLDTATTQFLYLSQEASDTADTSLRLASDGTYDAGTRRIKNLVDPVNAQDAATKASTEAYGAATIAAAAAAAAAAASPFATAAAASAAAALASENVTDADVVLTHADVVLTHADVVLTHADVVTTTADRIAAAASAASALANKNITDTNVATTATNVTTSGASATAAGVSASSAASSLADILGGFTSTSTTSLTLGNGTQSPTVQTGKAYGVGMAVNISRTSSPSAFRMTGVVSSYNTLTGALVTDITTTTGAGTFTDWTVTLGGGGSAGAAGDEGALSVATSSIFSSWSN